MRDQQTNELTPAELDMIAEGCPNFEPIPTPPLPAVTKQAPGSPYVRFPRLGISSFAALRALATLLISILIMLAGTLAAATFA
jgi:hypothetical protein